MNLAWHGTAHTALTLDSTSHPDSAATRHPSPLLVLPSPTPSSSSERAVPPRPPGRGQAGPGQRVVDGGALDHEAAGPRRAAGTEPADCAFEASFETAALALLGGDDDPPPPLDPLPPALRAAAPPAPGLLGAKLE
jgi:hypothetical protein